MISLTNHHSQWGRSEVVIIFPDTCKIPLCAFVSLRSAMRSSSSSDVLRFRSAAALRPCHFVEASRGWKWCKHGNGHRDWTYVNHQKKGFNGIFHGISAIQWDLTINNRDGIIWPTNNDDIKRDLTNKNSWKNRILPKIRSSMESITNNMELVIYIHLLYSGRWLFNPLEWCWHGHWEMVTWQIKRRCDSSKIKKMCWMTRKKNESWVV